MKRFITMVLNVIDSLIKAVEDRLFNSSQDVVWLTLEDRMNSEVYLDAGNSKNRRSQVRQYCIEQGIDKPWSVTSLRERKWKERVI